MATLAAPTRSAAAVGGIPRPADPAGWTIADLEHFPNDGLRYEIIDGVLLVSPSPTPLHQMVSARLHHRLDAACLPDHVVLAAPLDWQPGGTQSFQPDLLVVRRDDATGAKLTGVPLLLVEITSPATARLDRTLKFSAYADAGVPQYWIVDPGPDPTIKVYDLTDGTYTLQASATGTETLTVTRPVPVTITPADLTR